MGIEGFPDWQLWDSAVVLMVQAADCTVRVNADLLDQCVYVFLVCGDGVKQYLVSSSD